MRHLSFKYRNHYSIKKYVLILINSVSRWMNWSYYFVMWKSCWVPLFNGCLSSPYRMSGVERGWVASICRDPETWSTLCKLTHPFLSFSFPFIFIFNSFEATKKWLREFAFFFSLCIITFERCTLWFEKCVKWK